MKPFCTLLFIAIAIVLSGCDQMQTGSDSINPILGNASFVSTFGSAPTEDTDEDLRIRTHLAYVEDLLRKKDMSHLTAALQARREHLLDLLHTYLTAGVFPRNYDHKEKRVPCFIDIKGNICAVGYLIEQTAGRPLAEAINEKFKYAAIRDMRDERIDQWISGSGLTLEECAMIQPYYQWPNPVVDDAEENYISQEYAITSSLVTGANLSLSIVNGMQLSKGARSPAVGIVSLWTGTGSILLGAMNLPPDSERGNSSKQALSILNMGVGATTLVLGVCNLTSRKPKKNKTVAWNLYSFPEPGNKSGVGLVLTKRL